MSDATLRASIKTLMDTVTGIGKVYDYSRWAEDNVTLRSLFQTTPNTPLHGWEITREGFKTEKLTSKDKVTHNYLVLGHYAIKDNVASEKLFNAVIDAVDQTFRDNKITGSEGHSRPVVIIKEWMFAGVLCHRAEVRLQVSEIVAKTAEADEDLLKVMVGQYLDPDTDWVMWEPATAYILNDIVVPPEPNGRKYKCTAAGLSGVAEPVWPVAAGGTVVDGTVTWTEDGAVISVKTEISI